MKGFSANICNFEWVLASQPAFYCSMSTMETLEQCAEIC